MRILLLLFLSCIGVACEPEDNTPTSDINDSFDTAAATLLTSGNFVGSGHSVSGSASLYENSGTFTIVLDPFMTQNGPDLRVYVSTDENASSYISLGLLKSTTGKQSYEVPASADITGYNYVLIWCEQFTVLFGSAELQ